MIGQTSDTVCMVCAQTTTTYILSLGTDGHGSCFLNGILSEVILFCMIIFLQTQFVSLYACSNVLLDTSDMGVNSTTILVLFYVACIFIL